MPTTQELKEKEEKCKKEQRDVIFNSLNSILELQAVTVFMAILFKSIDIAILLSFYTLSFCSFFLFTNLIIITLKKHKFTKKYSNFIQILVGCSAIIGIGVNIFEVSFIASKYLTKDKNHHDLL